MKIKLAYREKKILQNKIDYGAKILCGIELKKMKENWKILCEWMNMRNEVKI
jgi:hypothetical protein